MGALGLEDWGRRPRGKGCLLLAVAGTTSLVTLLLAVPITVLAVLAVVPQKQGGPVTETTAPGAPAKAQQQRLGPQELPEQDAEADPSPRLPAAHLIGAWTQGRGLGWEAKKEEAFLRSGAQFSSAHGLALPRGGLYYLYCQVGYRGRAPRADAGPPERPLTLRSRLYRAGGANAPGAPELLLEGVETVETISPAADRTRRLWYTSVGVGGLAQLQSGERVYVNISHPDMVDYRRGKTFFGAVMVG